MLEVEGTKRHQSQVAPLFLPWFAVSPPCALGSGPFIQLKILRFVMNKQSQPQVIRTCCLTAVIRSCPRWDWRGWISGSDSEKVSLHVRCHMQNLCHIYHIYRKTHKTPCEQRVGTGHFCMVGRYNLCFSLFLGFAPPSMYCLTDPPRPLIFILFIFTYKDSDSIEGTMAFACLGVHHHKSFIFSWDLDSLPLVWASFSLAMFFRSSQICQESILV